MNEDLTTDSDIAAASSSPALVSPDGSYSFKGCKLWPMTAGSDILFNQVIGREDAAVTIFFSFIFIHLKRGGKTALDDFEQHVIPLCWNKSKFRLALIQWMDSLGEVTNDDNKQALAVFEDMRARARKSSNRAANCGAQKPETIKKRSRR